MQTYRRKDRLVRSVGQFLINGRIVATGRYERVETPELIGDEGFGECIVVCAEEFDDGVRERHAAAGPPDPSHAVDSGWEGDLRVREASLEFRE